MKPESLSAGFCACRFFIPFSKMFLWLFFACLSLPLSSVKLNSENQCVFYIRSCFCLKVNYISSPETHCSLAALFFASSHVFFSFFISVPSIFWCDHTCFSPHLPLWWVSSLCLLQAFLPQSIAHQAINTIICIGYIWADTLQSQKSKKKIYLGELFITEREALTQ